MKRLKKKILGILLSIVMVLGLMPVGMPVHAAQSDTYVTATGSIQSLWSPADADTNYYSVTTNAFIYPEGIELSPWIGEFTITAKNGAQINKMEIVSNDVYSGGDPVVSNGSFTTSSQNASPNGETYTFDGITSASISFKGTDFFYIKQFTVWYEPAANGAATSFDIPVTFMGTPDGNNTGHIELDQQVAIDTTQDTFLDIMPDGFVMHLRPADQNNAPASISGTYEFTYNGTTYTGSFTASLGYIQSANAMVYVSFPIAFNNSGSDSSSSSGHHHHKCENGHIFSFQVLEAPTTETDGVGMWCCERCGIPDWNEHENAAPGEKVVISAYTVFNDTLENNIKAAESGATVSITTSRWVSVRRGVLEALAEKPGVTLTVNFEYQGMGYVIAIPGGDPALAGLLASEDRFFGLMNLGNTFGLTAVEK